MPRQRGKAEDKAEIPSTIQRSDAHAQRLWKKVHQSAVKTYGEGGRAHRVAFAALKHEYEKKGDRWIRKAEKGPSDPQAARGPTTRPKSTDQPPTATARGKVAPTEHEARQKSREAGKEYGRTRKSNPARHEAAKPAAGEEKTGRMAALTDE